MLSVPSWMALFPLPMSSIVLLEGVQVVVWLVVVLVRLVQLVVRAVSVVARRVEEVVPSVSRPVPVLLEVVCPVVLVVVPVSVTIWVTNRLQIEGASLLFVFLAGRTLRMLHRLGWAQVAQLPLPVVVSTYLLSF